MHSDCAFILLTIYFHICHRSLGYLKSTPKPPSPFPAPGRHKEAEDLAFCSFLYSRGTNSPLSSSTEQDLVVSDALEHHSGQFTQGYRDSTSALPPHPSFVAFYFSLIQPNPNSQIPHLQAGSMQRGGVRSLNPPGSILMTRFHLPKPWAPPGSLLSISQN